MRAVALKIAATAALSGCDRSSETGPAAAAPAPTGASYKYEVRGAGGGFVRGQAERIAVNVGGTAASVQGGRLTVGGKGYGPVKDGDSIVVVESG
jgi:hypothetical protein